MPCANERGKLTGLKHEFIRTHREEYKLIRLCIALDISSSGYNDWLDRPESQRSFENKALTLKIRHSHEPSGEVYGSPKVHQYLIAGDETCSENRVARLMTVTDIKSIMARKFVVTTDSENTMQPAPDLLRRNFRVDQQDKA